MLSSFRRGWFMVACVRVLVRAQETDTSTFMLSMWRTLLFCPQHRLAAMNYLAVTVPKQKPQIYEFLPAQHSIAIQALIATLHDTNVLAQRKALELIISHFPLHPELCVFKEQEQVFSLLSIHPVLGTRCLIV